MAPRTINSQPAGGISNPSTQKLTTMKGSTGAAATDRNVKLNRAPVTSTSTEPRGRTRSATDDLVTNNASSTTTNRNKTSVNSIEAQQEQMQAKSDNALQQSKARLRAAQDAESNILKRMQDSSSKVNIR